MFAKRKNESAQSTSLMPETSPHLCCTSSKDFGFLDDVNADTNDENPCAKSNLRQPPSSDFTSHFVVRKSCDRLLESSEEKIEHNALERCGDSMEETTKEKAETTPSPVPSITRNTATRKFLLPFPSTRPVTAPPSAHIGGAAAFEPEDEDCSPPYHASKAKNTARISQRSHPFLASALSARSPSDSRMMRIACVPESPMDSAYHPIYKFCMPKKNQSEIDVDHDSPLSTNKSAYAAVLAACTQRSPIPIDLIFHGLKDLEKIGEGVYGEVYSGSFRYFSQASWVYKIVAIEGAENVNGEKQKTFLEILPEIIVSRELCKLRQGFSNCYTESYVHMRNARVAKGCYPLELVKCWDSFHEKYESDNDKPNFPPQQLYLVLEFEFAGQDIESFRFEDARQTLSIVLQVAHTLAVGEGALEFEHRDLHWGNILVQDCSTLHTEFIVNGTPFLVPAVGVKAIVIDFTISRLKDSSDKPVFLDLQDDEEQFLGTGDHQFDIYRMMRDHNRNNWEEFCPKSNVFWLHYLADKLVVKVRYENACGGAHSKATRILREFSHRVFEFDSAVSFVRSPVCKVYKEFLTKSTNVGMSASR